jgi:hypothetical protein
VTCQACERHSSRWDMVISHGSNDTMGLECTHCTSFHCDVQHRPQRHQAVPGNWYKSCLWHRICLASYFSWGSLVCPDNCRDISLDFPNSAPRPTAIPAHTCNLGQFEKRSAVTFKARSRTLAEVFTTVERGLSWVYHRSDDWTCR